MNGDRTSWKVGLFAVVGLVLFAALMLAFGKGIGLGSSRYSLIVNTSNVGGIKKGANVLMSGVPVGKVSRLSLSEDGSQARIYLDIYSRYQIHTNTEFNIQSMGFLGDAYVAINPTNFVGGFLKDGDEVSCQPPFDMQVMARSAVGFINRIDITAEKLNEAMGRLNSTLLSDESLSNATAAVATFRNVSDHSLTAVDDLHKLFATNSAPVAVAVSNLVAFSDHINSVADQLDALLLTNRASVGEVVNNFQAASKTVREIAAQAQAGQGVVGAILKDARLRSDFVDMVARFNSVGTNLDAITGRINSNGIWSALWKPKPPARSKTP